jgi:hypothetical protein
MWIIGLGGILVCGIYVYVEYESIWNICLM